MPYRAAVLLILLLSAFAGGCVPLLAGAAGGAGTAAWLSGKLSQEVNASYENAVRAADSGLKSLRLEALKQTATDSITQIRSKYTDGKEIWIDVRRVTESLSRIEVRVGVLGDKEAAGKILERINRYL